MTHSEIVTNVLREFGPLSDYGIYHAAKARQFDVTPSSIRSRRAELTKTGVVRKTTAVEPTGRGRTAAIWALA